MTTTHYVVGPPGCGKTDWVRRAVERSVQNSGPDRALVVSLTRAAAAEAAGRTNLDRKMVGTLHAHCYHALGRPDVVDGKLLKQWRDEYPDWPISGGNIREDVIDEADGDGAGDHLLNLVERARHTLRPIPPQAERFAKAWEDFKTQCSAVDFTDMIVRALHEIPLPPHGPEYLLADEAQDLSDLEVALLTRWSSYVDHFALVGDPNQSIYHWRHSSAKFAQITPTVLLGQSRRVPRSVQEFALSVVRHSRTYLDAPYAPREEEGEVRHAQYGYGAAERILRMVERLEGSVMILATCAYMLGPIVAVLRQEAVPYHNPCRDDSVWNPLARGTERRRTAVDRLLAFLALSDFLAGESDAIEAWQVALMVRTLKRSAVSCTSEALVDYMPTQPEPTPLDWLAVVKRVLLPESVAPVIAGDTDWLLEHARAEAKRSLGYPVAVLRTRGLDGLLNPTVAVGTIHSVKGGEADHVVLAPDLSSRGFSSWRRPGWGQRDGVYRTFYVGCTRARRTLTVLRPQGYAPIGMGVSS